MDPLNFHEMTKYTQINSYPIDLLWWSNNQVYFFQIMKAIWRIDTNIITPFYLYE